MQIVQSQGWESLQAEPGLLEELCLRLADGETVRELAEAWGVPCGRVQAWVMADEGRYTAYCRAQETYAHTLMSEVVAIADEGKNLGRDKLRIETRFRVAAAWAKGRYGEQGGGGKTSIHVVVQPVNAEGGIDDERGSVCTRLEMDHRDAESAEGLPGGAAAGGAVDSRPGAPTLARVGRRRGDGGDREGGLPGGAGDGCGATS